jgi:hypothetical protein
MASTPTTHTQIVESNEAIEDRIMQGIEILRHRGEKTYIATAAREFFVTESRLRERWNGRKLRYDRTPSNRKLREDKELAVCRYFDRLDEIGLSARLSMIKDCVRVIGDEVVTMTLVMIIHVNRNTFLARNE